MRAIGTIPDEAEARRFTDYLLTRNITTRLDARPAGCVVWVHREEQVDEARRQLDEFRTDPGATRYQGIDETARALRKKAEREEKLHVKNSISLSGRWDYRPVGRCPLTLLLISASVAVGVLSHMGRRVEPFLPLYLGSFHVIAPAEDEQAHVGIFNHPGAGLVSDGLSGLRRGEVWRIVTPIFIHYGELHLLFNMVWLFELGGLIELRKGSLYLLGLVLLSAIASNLGDSAYSGSLRGGGMSGVVYALFGFIWMRERYDPIDGLTLRPNVARYMLIWLVFCMSGAIGPVGNAAHVIGLGVGVLIGVTPHAIRVVRRWR